MMEGQFSGRVGLLQRVLPAYRVPFFDALASACQGGLGVFAGQPLPEENIPTSAQLQVAKYYPARNRHLFNPRSPLYQCWQDGLLAWLEEWQPQVLVVEANPRYPTTRQAIAWMHERALPVLGWGLGAPPVLGTLSAWRSWSRLNFLRTLDGLIAYSQRGAQQYRDLGVAQGRVYVASNAVAPRPEGPAPERPAEFSGPPVVLFVGRLQERKRIDNLLLACAALPPGLQPRLWVVGEGPARGAFETLAAEIYPQAQFPGERRGDELRPYFEGADLFVLPGSGGLAVQQAMASGLPVIAAEGDGTQEDLVRPENGWLVPPGDVQALQAALQEALSDPHRLRKMGAASYRIVSQEINLQAMVGVFLRALQEVSQAYRPAG